jgi:hypothetical protein
MLDNAESRAIFHAAARVELFQLGKQTKIDLAHYPSQAD